MMKTIIAYLLKYFLFSLSSPFSYKEENAAFLNQEQE